MSGRSGYGRSRFVGKIIHLPANMMIGGLAPRVGQPGQEYNIISPGEFALPTNRNIFRQNLAIAAGFTAATVVNPTNNISTTFTPGADLTITTDDCPPESGGGTTFTAPVGGFVIAPGIGEPGLIILP